MSLRETAHASTAALDANRFFGHHRLACRDAHARPRPQQQPRRLHKAARRYLQPFRETRTAPTAVPIPPTIRQVTSWLTRHPDSLDEDERTQLTQIPARSPELAATYRHVDDFAEIMTNRDGHRLPAWMRERGRRTR